MKYNLIRDSIIEYVFVCLWLTALLVFLIVGGVLRATLFVVEKVLDVAFLLINKGDQTLQAMREPKL
ncbi:hypothetical protein [Vibrio barjaei]|uniref:hypothetical protein n=1 Tax=Vibrio barjaei TaxID=1676683 RepID=UPI002284782D|nr:hypothetical protein [Vibrio barjaei]MCY9870507.1 hypothetical protein [Vibrio barjaei]